MLFSEKFSKSCTPETRLSKERILVNILGPVVICIGASCSSEQTHVTLTVPNTPESIQPSSGEIQKIKDITKGICKKLLKRICENEREFSVYVDTPNDFPEQYRIIITHPGHEPESSIMIGIRFDSPDIPVDIQDHLESKIQDHLLEAHSKKCKQRLKS
jgi:hypothetical protein